MSFIRGGAGQTIGAQLVSATDGSAFTGTVHIYITIDGGTQTIGSVNGGLCTSEGHGYHTYALAASETDGALIAYTFVGTGAIPQTIQILPETTPTLSPTTGGPATGAVTALSLISAALVELNSYMAGDDLSNADAQLGLFHLNGLIGAWAQQNLTVPSILRSSLAQTAGKGSTTNPYTIGSGGNLNIPRPANPSSLQAAANLLTDGVTESPLFVMTDAVWRGLINKDLTGTMAQGVYYQPTFTSGLGALYLWPVPTGTTYGLVLYTEAPLTTFADLTTSYQLPPGYQDALMYALARRLAKPFGRTVDEDLKDKADNALRLIKRTNLRLDQMSNYFGGTAQYSILTDQTYSR